MFRLSSLRSASAGGRPSRRPFSLRQLGARLSSATLTLLLSLALTVEAMPPPPWWVERGAVDPQLTPNHSAYTTQGQLKAFTQKAVQEMNARLPGGAGTALNALVAGWENDYLTHGYGPGHLKPADHQLMTISQIKYVANLVWNQLHAAGYAPTLPAWLPAKPATDHQFATLGQLKTVFAFDLSAFSADTDHNGIPDSWENHYFGHLGNDPAADSDGDGLTNLQEAQQGTDPTDYFNGKLPGLTIVSGNFQGGLPAEMLTAPLIIEVRDSQNALLKNAPFFYTPTDSNATISLTKDGNYTSSVDSTTDAQGRAMIWVKLPDDLQSTIKIRAGVRSPSAGVRTLEFTEYQFTSIPAAAASKPRVWLEANQGITLSGGAVQKWLDQSGNLNSAIPFAGSAASTRPVVGSLGNVAVVNFDGVDDRLTLPTNIGSNDFTIVVAVASSNARTSLNSATNYGQRFQGAPASGQQYLLGGVEGTGTNPWPVPPARPANRRFSRWTATFTTPVNGRKVYVPTYLTTVPSQFGTIDKRYDVTGNSDFYYYNGQLYTQTIYRNFSETDCFNNFTQILHPEFIGWNPSKTSLGRYYHGLKNDPNGPKDWNEQYYEVAAATTWPGLNDGSQPLPGSLNSVTAGLSVGNNGEGVFEHHSQYFVSAVNANRTVDSGLHLLTIKYQNRKPFIYDNGVLVGYGFTSLASIVKGPQFIGSSNVPGNYFKGSLAELQIFDGALSATEQAIVESGVALRANLASRLDPLPASRPIVFLSDDRTTARIFWRSNSLNETQFVLERSLDGTHWTTLATLPASVSSWTDTGLSSSQVYFYRVTGQNSASGRTTAAYSPIGNSRSGQDLDEDGLTNDQEVDLGTDPTKWDTDGDGVSDGDEYKTGTDPKDANSWKYFVTNSLPEDQEYGYPLNSPIILYFNKPLPAAVTTAPVGFISHDEYNSQGAVTKTVVDPGTSSFLPGRQGLAFLPSAGLAIRPTTVSATNYRLHFQLTPADQARLPHTFVPYDATFATNDNVDNVGPWVQLVRPGADYIDVAPQPDITVQFSQPLQPASINATNVVLTSAGGTNVTTALTFDSYTNLLKIAPTSPLQNSTTYTATLKTGLTGLNGQTLAVPFTWSFTTRAAPLPLVPGAGPYIVSVTPSPYAGDVPLGAPIVIVFSEAINPATLTAQNIHLRASGTGEDLAFTIAYQSSTFTLTLQPTSTFLPETRYEVSLDSSSVLPSLGNGRSLQGDSLIPFYAAAMKPPDGGGGGGGGGRPPRGGGSPPGGGGPPLGSPGNKNGGLDPEKPKPLILTLTYGDDDGDAGGNVDMKQTPPGGGVGQPSSFPAAANGTKTVDSSEIAAGSSVSLTPIYVAGDDNEVEEEYPEVNVTVKVSSQSKNDGQRWLVFKQIGADPSQVQYLGKLSESSFSAAYQNGDGKKETLLLIPCELIDTKDKVIDTPGTTVPEKNRDVFIEPKKDDDDKNPRSIAWIEPHGSETTTDAPDMPQLVLRFEGTDQMNLKIKWKLKVEYKRPNKRDLPEDKIAIPKTGDWVTEALDGAVEIYDNADWKTALTEKGFFGGDAELTFQLLKNDGSALGEQTTWKFRIGGKNPDNTKARDYLTSSQPDLWFAYAICKHETSEFRYGGTYYNQFVGNPKGKNLNYTKYSRSFPLAYGEPTWNWDYKDSKPGGFGLFQVTGWQGSENGNVPREVIWNWQKNMTEGANEIRRDKVPAATRYFNAVKSKYGQNISDPPATVTGKSRNLTGWEVSVIVRYNGVGGLDTHPELRPWLGRYTQDPWTYSGGSWSGPQPNSENYLRKVIPEIE